MKKRILGFIFVISILTSLIIALPITTSAATSGTCGDNLLWNFNDQGVLTISGEGEMHTYYSWNNEYVPWYEFKNDIKKVVLEQGVTNISYEAFSKCKNLKSVSLSDGLVSIDSRAFYCCSSLYEINIPNDIAYISSQAFSNCIRLYNISLPDSIINIGDKAFKDTAYYNEDSNWENNVLYINNHLIKANDEFAIATYFVKDGTKTIGDGAFDGCTALRTVSMPETVKRLGWRSFAYCTGLQDIVFPRSIEKVDEFTFLGCSGLENIYITDLEAWCGLRFGAGHANPLSNAENLYINDNLITELIIPESVISINSYLFYGMDCLEKVIIPDTVTSIGREAFGACENLKEMVIGKGLTSIDVDAIPNDVSLVISDENNSFSFSDGALYNKNKTKLIQFFDDGTRKNYTIPDSVTQIDKWAFQNCTVLEKIIIGKGIRTIGQYAFSYCMSITEVEIGENVKTISSQAFYNCQNLKSIIIPDNVTSIGIDAFLNCRNLESISLGIGITGISTQAFCQCVSLKNLIIPDNVTFIGNRAFESCISLKEITLGSNVKTIYDRAFYGCKNLENINIKNKLTKIGEDAFYGCNKLKTVKYFDVKEKWDAITVATGNNCITKSTILCTDTIDVIISDEENDFIVSPTESINSATILLALYKDNKFVNVYISNYEGEEVLFNICEDYDVAKIFIWGDLKRLQPICSETHYYKSTYKFLNLCNNTTDEWNGIFEALTSGLYEYYNYSIITAMDEWDILKLAKEIYYIQNKFSAVSHFDDICKEAYNNLYN